ncbi:MAG: MarR family transcriptional regulator [Bacteroidota bacterium]
MKIEEEIKQSKFKNEFQKLQINVLFTASWLNQRSTRLLKPYKISWQQFNILRILRGRHPEPATVKVLASRMIDKTSNASRLVEKLRQKGYVERSECQEDRRRVDIILTDLGMKIVNQASETMETELLRITQISEEEAKTASDILDSMRNGETEIE